MYRKLLSLFLVIFLFAGCGKQATKTALPNPSTPSIAEPETPTEDSRPPAKEPSAPPQESSTGEESFSPPENPPLPMDDNKILLEDRLVLESHKDYIQHLSFIHASESYTFLETLSYEDTWYREFAAYFPKFNREEIPYDGLLAIDAHYQAQYDQLVENAPIGELSEPLFHSALFYVWHNYTDYSCYFVESYVSVEFFNTCYLGGVHTLYGYFCDTWNMKTGERLELVDVLGQPSAYAPAVISALDNYREQTDIYLGYPSDPAQWTAEYIEQTGMQFSLTKEGIRFLFNPYTIGPFSSGATTVLVPYHALAEALMLAIPLDAS